MSAGVSDRALQLVGPGPIEPTPGLVVLVPARPRSPLPGYARVAKRALDVVVALVVLLLALPLLLLAMAATCLETPGSPIFSQERVGWGGRTFRLFKLRTMGDGNDESAHQAYMVALMRGEAERHNGVFKLVNDPRVTRVGRVLRRYSLDELPQMWNVLKGEMSLVGPRPALPREVRLFDARANQRTEVKPGITGLAQVSGRNRLTFKEQLDLDIRYGRAWTPLMELSILLRTPWTVLTGGGTA